MYTTDVSSGESSLTQLNINRTDIETTTVSHLSRTTTEILREDSKSIPNLVAKCWILVERDDVQGLERALRGATIDKIINEEGFTLLHITVFKNR